MTSKPVLSLTPSLVNSFLWMWEAPAHAIEAKDGSGLPLDHWAEERSKEAEQSFLKALRREREPDFDAKYIILGWASREEMYRRIDARVDEMVAQGLFREVEGLLREGLPDGSTAMQAIGYKEAVAALRGECSRDEAIEKIKRETRRYAKRQLTWLRQREGALRIDWEETPDLASALRDSTAFLLRCGIR